MRFWLDLTNTGNLTLTDLDWAFSLQVGQVLCESSDPLAPGDTRRCWVDYVATATDAAVGTVLLEATVGGATARAGVQLPTVAASGVVQVALPPPTPTPPPTPPGTVDPAPGQPSVPPPADRLDAEPDRPTKLPRTGGPGGSTPIDGSLGSMVAVLQPMLVNRRDDEED